MKMRVLVFPCGTEIGLEVYKSLEFSTHFELFGGSSADDHGKFVYKNYIGEIPFVDQPNFIEKINEIVKANDIDFIIPAHDSVVLKLAQAANDNLLSCQVITSPLTTCDTSRSKLKTYGKFRGIIPVPRVFSGSAEVNEQDYPIFLKPDIGQGSRGVHKASNLEDLDFYTKKDPTLMLLEFLPGREYTVDCFTSKNGELVIAEARVRNRISNGISVNSTSTKNDQITEYAHKINKTLSFRGAWFFQLKEDKEGKLVLLEIAPRIAGTMGLIRCRGVNLVLMSLFDAMDIEVQVTENKYDLTIDRALGNRFIHNINYQHVYIDFDDLVVFGEKINPLIMAFIFQSINNKKKVHLLTRHKHDIKETLKAHRLSGLFDSVIQVSPNDEKYAFITEKDAIFIDDSFAERKKVQQIHQIPVFDSHMVESLIEIM